MNKAKIEVISKPPNKLNFIDTDIKIKTIPKYIGFLEKLKTPEITNEEACSGLRGLIVVWCFLKDAAEINKMPKPANKIKILKILFKLWIYSGKNGLEK